MPKVLTESSTLKCSSQGTVQLTAGQSKLTVGGAKVLVEGDLAEATISGCTLTDSSGPPPTVQCKKVSTVMAGAATKLKVDGKPVFLDTAQGSADGLAPAPETFSVQSAGQDALQAV